MGFFAGVVEELNRIEDRGERRAEFMAALLEKRKNTVIPTLVERLNAEKEDLAERRERVQQAQVLGLSKKAAAVLESSGALELELDRLKKLNEKGELNRKALGKISEQNQPKLEWKHVSLAPNSNRLATRNHPGTTCRS